MYLKESVCLTESKFKQYGKISGIDINPSGFGFVQFEKVIEAQRACNEDGTLLKGRKLGM